MMKEVIAIVLAVFLAMAPFVYWIEKRVEAKDAWCEAHGFVPLDQAKGPVLCYDNKTRVVYKPE